MDWGLELGCTRTRLVHLRKELGFQLSPTSEGLMQILEGFLFLIQAVYRCNSVDRYKLNSVTEVVF